MFPIGDDNPTLRRPLVTYALIGANALMWLAVQGAGAGMPLLASVCNLGLTPGNVLQSVAPGTAVPLGAGLACVVDPYVKWWTVLTHMFLHGGWMHILGNMWFLWIFGNNVEDSMGRARFLLFYLLCGFAAAGLQLAFTPTSAVPMVGASGAIGGVMGAYVMLYPRVRIHMIFPIIIIPVRFDLPAFLMLGYWFALQLLGGWQSFGDDVGGTAFWAHVGGFVAGATLVFLFRDDVLVAEHRAVARTM